MRPAATNIEPIDRSARRRASARQIVIEGEVLRSSSPDRMAANENRAASRGPGLRLRASAARRRIGAALAALRALAARTTGR